MILNHNDYMTVDHNMALKTMMVKLTPETLAKAVDMAVELVTQSGRIIATPTDTIYGLSTAAQDVVSVKKLYEIKGRVEEKPVAICVGDIQDIYRWAQVDVPFGLLTDLLPGPVTLVFNRSSQLNHALNPGTRLLGIRIPDYQFIREVARRCGPLALTSANRSSLKSSLSVEEFEDLWPNLDAVFDGGRLGHLDPMRLGSTVVDLSEAQDGYYRIIRDGCAFHSTKNLLENKYNLHPRPDASPTRRFSAKPLNISNDSVKL